MNDVLLKKRFKKTVFGLLNYLPGLIILIFGMVALHAAVQTVSTNQRMAEYYEQTSRNILELEQQYQKLENVYNALFIHEDGVLITDAERALKKFTTFYDQKMNSKTWSSAFLRDDHLKVIIYEIESDLLKQSKALDVIHSEAGHFHPTADLKTIHSVGRKINEMWEVLHNSAANKRFYENLKRRGDILYWSVIAIGLAGFVLVVLNSSRLKQLQAANEEKQSHLKLLQDRFVAMESSFDGIGIVDKNGNLTYMNKALIKLHGIAPEDKHKFLGQSWASLYGEEGREEISKDVMPVLLEKGYWRGEKHVKRIGGDVVYAELSLTALVDGGFIGTARDISDREKIQKEKEELQSQFYQAQKMEAIGRLAGGIAHDFNNILAAMNGYAEFLVDDLEQETPQHRFAQNILQAGQQARGLVDQILAFSRIKESKTSSMDVLTSVNETLAMIDASFSKTIEIKTNIALEHAPIEGNETQISQVIMNLCVNAKDSMDERHGVLTIELDRVSSTEYLAHGIVIDKDDDELVPVRISDLEESRTRLTLNAIQSDKPYIRLKVSDTGSGMSRLIMEHVFEPFFTTKPVEKGTGLGLSTVHGVVIDHNAAMIIDSTLDKGTTFEILFPEAERAQEKEVEVEAASVSLQGYNVLLVEDQGEVRDMMVAMLERMGVQVNFAKNGMEALELIQESLEDFDVVITDQNMPKLTGLELVQQAHEGFPDLPFVLLSGYSEEKLQTLMHEHPAIKAVLRKPVSQKKLKASLVGILETSLSSDVA